MTHSLLAKLVNDLNTTCGYSGRYTLMQRTRHVNSSVDSYQSWAIMKKEGALDRNVSGWGTPLQLRFWVLGHLEGYDACLRRSDKPGLSFSFTHPPKDEAGERFDPPVRS